MTVGNDNPLYHWSHQISRSGADPFAPTCYLGLLEHLTAMLQNAIVRNGILTYPLRCAEPRSPNPFRHDLSLLTLFDNER